MNKTKQRRRKNRKARMAEERVERATGNTTTMLKLNHPDYEGATGVSSVPDPSAIVDRLYGDKS